MTRTLVMKFGGTSTGSAAALNQAAEIVVGQSGRWERLVVVVSAMAGVTDQLIGCVESAQLGSQGECRAETAALREHILAVVRELFGPGETVDTFERFLAGRIDELDALCAQISAQREATPQLHDAAASLGERINARVFAALLRQRGLVSEAVEATRLIVTDRVFQNASPDLPATQERIDRVLVPLTEAGAVPVVTGFIGATEEGDTTTLGRGGSDYTACILGNCLQADEIWIWTDVDGVMTTDPNIASEARLLPEISYQEIYDLANFGAKVLHPKAILPVLPSRIPIWIKNTFNPGCDGTRISASLSAANGRPTAVSVLKKMYMITIKGKSVLETYQSVLPVIQQFTEQRIDSVLMPQSSVDKSFSILLPAKNAGETVAVLKAALKVCPEEESIPGVVVQEDVALITVFGKDLGKKPGVLAEVFSALEHAESPTLAVAQGLSNTRLSLVVKGADADPVVRQIHNEVILNGCS